MKGVVEEGLNVLMGHRLRVSLADCSLDRLRSMVDQIDAEVARLARELDETETEIQRLYASGEEVKLVYEAGAYYFPLDRHKESLADVRERIADLADKRHTIFSAFQEKTLLERQSRILGGRRMVRFKDSVVFVLILLVLAILAIDAGNIGAGGTGALLKPVVENGSVVSVEVDNPGAGYEAAYAVPSGSAESPGRGAEVFLEIDAGKIVKATIVDPGSGYDESLRLRVRPRLAPQKLHLFWLIDFSCCLVFLANFLFELILANSRRWYWRTHWIDFVTSIPLPPAQIFAQFGLSGGEALRAGRLLRVLRLLQALRALRLFLFMWRGLDQLAEILDVRLMKKSLFGGLILLALGAALISLFGERGDGHEAVSGFLPGLWWSFTTLVTGGFGDIYNPHTLWGRLLTVFLVLSGMVLVGVFTATLTTILVGREERAQSAMQNEVLNKIKEEGERSEAAIQRMEDRQANFSERFKELEDRIQRIDEDRESDEDTT